MHLLTLNVFAANFRVVLVVVTFFLSFSLWWIWTLLFFFLVEIVSESTLIETSFARQPHGASISSLPSSTRATAPESWIFGAHNVQALRRWGRPRQGLLGALEKKTWAWGMSPNLKFHTPANPHTCTEQTNESNGRFLDEPWWPRLLLSKFLPSSTVICNPWKRLTLTRGGRFRWHLSIPQRRSWTCVRRPSTSVPRNWRFTFPFCSATRSDTAAVRLVNVKLGLDSEKGSLPATLEVWTEKLLSVDGTDYIHFTAWAMHSMFRALFGVPHLFARELLMNSPHCNWPSVPDHSSQ